MKYVLILLFLVSFSPVWSNGIPTTASAFVSGVVFESETHETLPGVRVAIVGTDLFTYSDKDGKFEFPTIPSGEIQLSFSLVSFDKNQIQLSATPNQKTELAIQLVPR